MGRFQSRSVCTKGSCNNSETYSLLCSLFIIIADFFIIGSHDGRLQEPGRESTAYLHGQKVATKKSEKSCLLSFALCLWLLHSASLKLEGVAGNVPITPVQNIAARSLR